MIRQDITLVEYARSLGYRIDRGRDDFLLVNGKLPTYKYGREEHIGCSGDSYKFYRGKIAIWLASRVVGNNRVMCWICATCNEEGGFLLNPQYYDDLKIALDEGVLKC
jgi:hypothetical protein